jgi:hypothetical protein
MISWAPIETANPDTETLLSRLRAFCLPGGEEAARQVRSIRITQRGEMRMTEAARWIPFTAEETIDAKQSSFCWQARLDPGRLGSPTVTDTHEAGHGWVVVKLAGVLPVKKFTGPDVDRGELQRYLASVVFCPAMLLNHPMLVWSVVNESTLRVRDHRDLTRAAVDLEIDDHGRPLAIRADRPRIVGKESILTPWEGTCEGFHEWEGMRVPTRVKVAWHPPEGMFTYFRAEIASFEVEREA